MYHLYASQQKPNGAHDVITCDQDGQIVSVAEDLIFGLPTYRQTTVPDLVFYCDGDCVFPVREDVFTQLGDWENTVIWISEQDLYTFHNQRNTVGG